jgi:AraC family transcriptional regulator, transcriptional activator FtrA
VQQDSASHTELMSRTRGPANKNVVAIAYDGLCSFEFGIATELFGLARPELQVPWYRYKVIAATPGPCTMLGGVEVSASHDLRHVRQAGTIVLPGWTSADIEPPQALVAALRTAHRNGARIMSICSGAFLLAATGLLDGLQATTHWRYADSLAERFPNIEVLPNVLYVDNGKLLTSAGSAAGIDLGLHLIRRDYGAAIAATVARRLVMPPQREGGQAQFIIRRASTSFGTTDDPLARTLRWAEQHLADTITVQQMAQHAHMSMRTFARRFTDELGTTPLAWLTTQRLRRAQELLETTSQPIEDVALHCGFGSVETLRHHFRKGLQTSPYNYRRTFTAP